MRLFALRGVRVALIVTSFLPLSSACSDRTRRLAPAASQPRARATPMDASADGSKLDGDALPDLGPPPEDQAQGCQLAAGDNYVCLRKPDGTLWCWGANWANQLGRASADDTSCDASVSSSCYPNALPVSELGHSVASVAAGDSHTCAVELDGTLWCWGLNDMGQIGNGSMDESVSSPQQVVAVGTDIVEVAAGWRHTCALKSNGTLWCWGHNGDGELGIGTTDGVPCNTNSTCQLSPLEVNRLGNEVVHVAAHDAKTCALKMDGSVWCWGSDLSRVNDDLDMLGQRVVAIQPTPQQVLNLEHVSSVALGLEHACGLKDDGTLWCWGYNLFGELGATPSSGSMKPLQVTALGDQVTAVAAGYNYSCARKRDGTVWCWGNNSEGELGDGMLDGTPCYMDASVCKPAPVNVRALSNAAVDLTAGVYFTCARRYDGAISCWGENGNGELGDGTTDGMPCGPRGIACNATPVRTLLSCL